MSYTTILQYETMRTLDTSTLSGSYVAVGTPLANAASIVKMVNNSNVLVTVSINGTTDVDVLPANSFWLYDATTNHPTSTQGVFVPKNTQFFVKGSAGTGLVYLVVLYVVIPAVVPIT